MSVRSRFGATVSLVYLGSTTRPRPTLPAGNGASIWATRVWRRASTCAFPAGYAEGIALDTQGFISEGSGENMFVIRDGKIHTPPLGASVLPGITRDSILQIARDLDIPVVETIIPREMLYIADEVFFTGTAAEVTPIRSVDRIQVGEGRRGPITERLQREFFGIVNGVLPDRYGWLTPVETRKPVEAVQ